MGRGCVMTVTVIKKEVNHLFELLVCWRIYRSWSLSAASMEVYLSTLHLQLIIGCFQLTVFLTSVPSSPLSNTTTPPNILASAQYPTLSAAPFGYWSTAM